MNYEGTFLMWMQYYKIIVCCSPSGIKWDCRETLEITRLYIEKTIHFFPNGFSRVSAHSFCVQEMTGEKKKVLFLGEPVSFNM